LQDVHNMRILEPARKKKCAACRKPTGGVNDLCDAHAAEFARIYGPKEEDQGMRTKGQKLTSKVAGAPRALSHDGDRERTLAEVQDCLYEVVAGDERPSAYGLTDREAADRVLRAMGDDGLKVLARAEVAWLERVEAQKEKTVEERAEEDELSDVTHESAAAETPAEALPAPTGEKADRIPGWRSTPSKVVKSMLDLFKWFDWEAVGVPGVLGAEALLKNAHAELVKKETAAAKKPPKKVAVGVVCRVREKHREAYDGLLGAEDLVKLTVLGLNGKHARVRTAGGETFLPRAEHLEVDPDAEQPS
jgi:hypothetical protein